MNASTIADAASGRLAKAAVSAVSRVAAAAATVVDAGVTPAA
ncbi:MAG: hypothetical protein R3B82_11090 [Sandaracinaceae bacterium]